MKKVISSIAIMLFAGTINATTDAEIYHGFAKGNPDLETGAGYEVHRSASAVQPGIGSGSGMMRTGGFSANQIYHGFERGNPDLYSGYSRHSVAAVPGIGSRSSASRRSVATDNDIYHGFEKNNPDL